MCSPAAGASWDTAQAVTAIYITHYRSLVRLAVLLVRDVATAEEIVQDSFIAMPGMRTAISHTPGQARPAAATARQR